MSQPGSTSAPVRGAVQRQRFNVYTMMLILSFLAILTACILLYIELTRYGEYPWWDTKAVNVPTTSAVDIESSSRSDALPWRADLAVYRA